jgi:hypothetical protein
MGPWLLEQRVWVPEPAWSPGPKPWFCCKKPSGFLYNLTEPDLEKKKKKRNIRKILTPTKNVNPREDGDIWYRAYALSHVLSIYRGREGGRERGGEGGKGETYRLTVTTTNVDSKIDPKRNRKSKQNAICY